MLLVLVMVLLLVLYKASPVYLPTTSKVAILLLLLLAFCVSLVCGVKGE